MDRRALEWRAAETPGRPVKHKGVRYVHHVTSEEVDDGRGDAKPKPTSKTDVTVFTNAEIEGAALLD